MKYNCIIIGALFGLVSVNAIVLTTHNNHKLMTRDDNIQIENIYGIPNEKEKLMMKAQKMAQQKTQTTAGKRNDLVNAFGTFSKNLKESEFDKGMKLREELLEMNESAESINKVRINACELYKKQFSFPEVAKNDYSSEVIDELDLKSIKGRDWICQGSSGLAGTGINEGLDWMTKKLWDKK